MRVSMRACVFACALLVLAVVSTVVDGAAASPTPLQCPRGALRREQQRALRLFFDLRLDHDHDGFVDKHEYRTFMESMDPEDMPTLPFELLADRFGQLDVDGDGRLSLPEMCVALDMCTADEVRAPRSEPGLVGARGERRSALQRALDDSSTAPQQLHLQLTTDPGVMLVSWAQNTSAAAQVQWDSVSRAAGGQYASQAQASAQSYSVAQGGLTYTSLPLLSGAMSSLSASATYFYRVGNDAAGWSPEFSFVSMPDSKGAHSGVAKFLVVGDMGTIVPMGSTVTKWMEAEIAAEPGYNLTLHVGDLAYAGLSTAGGEWEPTWDAWMSQIAPLASAMPYVTPVGNHERFFNYTSFLHRFQMPSAGSKGRTNFWWSFDFGPVHFTSISTEDDLSVGSEQYQWLVDDLVASASNPAAQWLVLMCHRPLYSSDVSEAPTHVPGSPFLRSLEPIMRKFKVDLVLTGHMHMYERTYPVYNGTVVNATHTIVAAGSSLLDGGAQSAGVCATAPQLQPDPTVPLDVFVDPQAPVFVVQGTAGAMQHSTIMDPVPAWSAVRTLSTYGFGSLSLSTGASGCTSLLYQFKGNEARDVVDQFMLQKQV